MKLSVLALDYDGTIAPNDRVPSSVRNLSFVDGVVAENGALVHFQAPARPRGCEFGISSPRGDRVRAADLHAALNILRATPRNTVAIGDAENDHELLRLAARGGNHRRGR